MKIILQGLQMKSEIINVSDNQGPEYLMIFEEAAQVVNYNEGIPMLPPITTRCIFRHTGKKDEAQPYYIKNSNGDVIATRYPLIYRLVEISKI